MGFRNYTEIVFEAGKILSEQMLEETYSYPREFLQRSYANYCNGIINGLDFISREDGVYLTAGIVKIGKKYYILPQDINLDEWLKEYKPELRSSIEYFLLMTSEDILTSKDRTQGIKSHSRFILKAEREMPEGALLLAKYKFRPDAGISLPTVQWDNSENPFDDFFQSGLLQILECEYAHAQGKTTYHPLIFRAIQDYLKQKYPLSPYDFSLLMELENRGMVAITSLMTYIALNKEHSSALKNMTRKELFREVIKCIQKPYEPTVNQFTKLAQDSSKKNKPHTKLI